MTNEDIASSRLSARFAQALNRCATFLHACNLPCLVSSEDALTELAKLTQRPFNVAVFGRMKTGKSSLINALLGAPLAITGTEEATATINLIKYSDDPHLIDKFVVHWIGQPPETFPLSALQKDWTGKSEEVKERVRRTRFIQLYSNYPALKLHEIIDTPGTGSDAEEHENAAQAVINNFSDLASKNGTHSDALIYVFPPVGRENDEDALRSFRSSCLPDSTPYNSVGVLHKWDHILWENGGDFSEIQKKADVLKNAMDGMLADVLPLSAPLATAALQLPDLFFEKIKDVIKNKQEEKIQRLLSRDERWDKDEQCRLIRQIAGELLPWSSFQVVVRECKRSRDCSIAEIKKNILSLSGFPSFRKFLDQKFFAMGAIIRQKQNKAKLEKIHQTTIGVLETERKKLAREKIYWEELYSQTAVDLKLRNWIEDKHRENLEKNKYIKKIIIDIDKIFIDGEVSRTIADMDALRWSLDAENGLFDVREQKVIQLIFNYFCGFIPNKKAFKVDEIATLANKIKVYAQFYPDSCARKHAQHIFYRIIELKRQFFYEQEEGGANDLC